MQDAVLRLTFTSLLFAWTYFQQNLSYLLRTLPMSNVCSWAVPTIPWSYSIRIRVNYSGSKYSLFHESSSFEMSRCLKMISRCRYSGHKTGEYYLECGVDNTDTYVFSGSVDGAIWCWDLVKQSSVSQLIHSDKAAVHSLSVHPNQSSFLSASGSSIKMWSAVATVQDKDSWVPLKIVTAVTP